MENSSNKMIVRKLFQHKVYSSDGQSYEDLFTKIMTYSNADFRPVRPQGAIGDKKNDGYINSEGIYYQVYAPESLETKVKASIKKLYESFEGLYQNWKNVKKFYYVLNDKYKAAYPNIELALKDLEDRYKVECKPFLAKDLEEVFMSLKEDQIKMIIGDYLHIDSVVYECGYRHIKLHQNKNFIGRSHYLKAMYKFIHSKKGIHTVVIKGLAGTGKSQLALEYIFQYQHDYPVIFWINAENKETIEADFSEIYHNLGFSSEEKKKGDVVKVILRILEGNNNQKTKWLMVFDNAPDEDTIHDYIPKNGNGDCIITSQSDHWFNVDFPIALEELSKDDASDLLRIYSLVNDEDEAIKELSSELGCLPLALVQAGAYIRMSRTTVRKYLDDFKTERKREYLLATSSPIGKKGLSKDYDFVISTVWKKTFQTIKNHSPTASKVLQWLSFISTTLFPLEQLKLLINFMKNDTENNSHSDSVIAWLTNYSLISLHGDGLTIHTLVQLVTRDELDVKEKHIILGNLSKGLVTNSRYNIDVEKKYIEEMNLLAPHYIKLAGYLDTEDIYPNHCVELWYLYGKFRSRENLMFDDAIMTLKKAISRIKQIELDFTSEHRTAFFSSLSKIYNEIAFVYEQQGNLNRSIEIYQICLDLDKKSFGENSSKLISRYNNLAVNYTQLGKFNEAYFFFKKCLSLHEQDHSNEASILTIFNNIASTLTALGKYNEANGIIQETIQKTINMYGENYYGLANLYNNYADILEKFDEFDEAIDYYKKSLKISDTRYLDKNPHKETALNNIGLVLIKKFEINEAISVFDEALENIYNIYGEVHPSTAKTYSNIGLAYMENSDYPTATEFFLKAVLIGEKVYDKPHPEMAKFFNNLGWSYLESDKLLDAEKYLQKSNDVKALVYDSEKYPDFATTYINLGTVSFKKALLGDSDCFAKAKALFEKGLEIDTEVYGQSSVEVANDSVIFAQLLIYIKEKNQAISFLENALQIYKSKFGDIHPRIGEIYLLIGSLYFSHKEYLSCKVNLESAVKILKRYLNNPNTLEKYTYAVFTLKMLDSY